MSTDFIFRSGDRAAPRSLAQVPLLLGTCKTGAPGTSYTFDPADDVATPLGPGKATALAQAMGQIGRCVVSPVSSTFPSLPSITHLDALGGNSPTGPTISIALTGSSGPFDDAPNWKLTITADAARLDISYDGTSTAETIPIPPELPAVLRGTVAITPTILGSLSATHFDATAPAAKVLTFPAGSLTASSAGLKAATATVAAPVTVLAVALLAAGIAALLANPRKLRFTTAGGTAADAPATVAITGTDYTGAALTETLSLAQTATSATSVNVYATIVSLVYATADGTGATVAVGYEDAYATAAEMVAEINALAVAAPLAVRARLAETTVANYLELYTTSAGSGVSLTLDLSASTADSLLGFAVATATGAAATKAFAWLGATLAFPAGPYIGGESYRIPIAGPRGAVADYTAALTAAIGNFAAHPFGYVAVVEDTSTNANARALYDALRAIAATYQHDPDNPVLFDVLTPTALHVASSTKATNDANLSAFETDLLSAFSGATVSLESVVVDDCYIAGPAQKPGTERRPATWAAVLKRSSLDRLAGNPCDGRAPLVSLAGADGTQARDDAKRTTKFAGLAGIGFWVLKSTQDGGTKFAPSATRAGSLDRYRNPGVVAFALEASRAILPQLQEWEGTWEVDPGSPKAADPALLTHRAGILDALIRPVAFPDNKPKNVGNYVVNITAPTVADDGNVFVAIDFNPLAVAESVRATITATGVSLVTAA